MIFVFFVLILILAFQLLLLLLWWRWRSWRRCGLIGCWPRAVTAATALPLPLLGPRVLLNMRAHRGRVAHGELLREVACSDKAPIQRKRHAGDPAGVLEAARLLPAGSIAHNKPVSAVTGYNEASIWRICAAGVKNKQV